ncbi:transporter substrate-binding domain-containing protein [Janthinobacterium sp. hw3]|uniref:Transporter substrate-binding domain-containing protein n=1 Tax=Janthinobacterium fluminis TaxID=2987524 RepID=A0ABT5K7B7_9BURK|nr:transporter substrate-binding domain-containing protein [Janthinobacterium fluminis]
MTAWLTLAPGMLAALPAQAQTPAALVGGTIGICDDAAEWPPYIYYRREAGGKTAEVRGNSLDVVAAIFARHGIRHTIRLLPWKRCLQELASGTQYQMLLSASSNPERLAAYHLSLPYYQTHYHYFYSRRTHPNGLDVRRQADLNRYTLGGIYGYAYSLLGEVNKEAMTRTGNYVSLVKMLHLGRIEVFAEDIEVIEGMSRLGAYDFANDPELGHAPLPGVSANAFHMMFTKASPVGAALKELIDRELLLMEKSGQLQKLLDAPLP